MGFNAGLAPFPPKDPSPLYSQVVQQSLANRFPSPSAPPSQPPKNHSQVPPSQPPKNQSSTWKPEDPNPPVATGEPQTKRPSCFTLHVSNIPPHMHVQAFRDMLQDWGIRYLRVTKVQNKSYGFVRVFKLSDLENVQQQIEGIACPQNGEANAPISYLKAALAKWELNLLPGKPKNSTPKPPQPNVALPTEPQQPPQIPSSTIEIATVPSPQSLQPLT